MNNIIKKSFSLSAALFLLTLNSFSIEETSIKGARRFYAERQEQIVLNVYNSADYIAEDEENEDGTISKGLISKFEDFCKEHGKNVKVAYSCFDTNETMLGELRTGKVSYDLVCPSDYVIQKMIKEDMIVPYDSEPTEFAKSYWDEELGEINGSTPYYNTYVSKWINSKMSSIEVNGKEGEVNSYARGYMWGTLGILYNDQYAGAIARGITPSEMDKDMQDWRSLWSEKYNNLLAIKDSMRDTYAVGVLYTFYDEFVSLKNKYENNEISEDEYNERATEIFNRCDDETLDKVQTQLDLLKDNSFGFEVDSGKTDMAQGNKFAIDIAWSGDAAYAMDLADEANEANEERGVDEKTTLKYALPSTGANIWFDGWVMPKAVEKTAGHKEIAQAFVDFLSMPENVVQNMEYIGYTSVIAGDDVLDLAKSLYDIRCEEDKDGNGTINNEVLEDYEEVESSSIASMSDEDKESSYFVKDINYFFNGTLEEYTAEDTKFYVLASEKDRQFDTQYPDQSQLPYLCIMADFGDQNEKLLTMWEKVKNTNLPIWAYILIILVIVGLIGFFVFRKVQRRIVLKQRAERKKAREEKAKKAISNMKMEEKAKKKAVEAENKANKKKA